MGSKFWTVFNWVFLVIVTLVAVWVVFGFPQDGGDVGVGSEFAPAGDCVDVSSLDKFEYQACYDAYSETIFLKVNRGESNYQVNNLALSFVDLSSQSFDLEGVPGAGEEKAYKIPAKKNPGNMNVRLEVVRNFSGSVCGSKNIFVDYCPAGTSGEGVDVSISPIEGVGIKDFIDVEDFPDFDSDIVSMSLVDKESIWESTCKSVWDCGEWESCDDDVQRRDCKDLSGCAVSTDSPISVRMCDGSCIEKWECEWGDCQDGISKPKCSDLNKCGTSFNIPKELLCEKTGRCSPNVACSDWTECDVDYSFDDLIGADKLTQLDGVKTRVCVDKKGCVETEKEEQVCSVSVDIYTKRFEKCGDSYVGVYDVLDDSTLAILKEGSGKGNYLNIYFGNQDKVYCDYCFDGKMNGDEEDVDCGGSCKKCAPEFVEKKRWWEFLF